MRKLLLLCALSISFRASIAEAGRIPESPDVNDTIKACGKPLQDITDKDDDERALRYKHGVEIWFKGQPGSQRFTHGETPQNNWIRTDDLAKEFPCFSGAAESIRQRRIEAYRASPEREADKTMAMRLFGLGTGFLIILFAAYFIPIYVAYGRKVNRPAGIVVLNILLGWCVIGWIAALIWAIAAETRYQAQLREAAYRQMIGAGQIPRE